MKTRIIKSYNKSLVILSVSILLCLFNLNSSKLLARNYFGVDAVFFTPDSTNTDSTIYNNGDTVAILNDGEDIVYILFEDTANTDSANLNKTFAFPTPHILVEILDKSLPVNKNQFGINVTDIFEPGKANLDNLDDYTYTGQPDPWILLSALKPEILRFPSGSGSKYMHLMGSDNPDGTRNGGYGFRIEEIINFYDFTDGDQKIGGLDIDDIPIATLLITLANDYAFDGKQDCIGCETWMNPSDKKSFNDYYEKWAEQPVYNPAGMTLEEEPLYVNQLIKLVQKIEGDNPEHQVDIVVCLNIMSETSAKCKQLIDYIQFTNTIHLVNVAGVELGNECYFKYFERTLGFVNTPGGKSPFDHYWNYVNGGNYSVADGFLATEQAKLFNSLPSHMETSDAHNFIAALKGDLVYDIQIGIPVANLPNCSDHPFFSDPDEGETIFPGGALPPGCDIDPWNVDIVEHYDDMISPFGGSARHVFDAVILHPYYTPKNNPLAIDNENWFFAPMCIDGNPLTPVVFDGDNAPPFDSGMERITSGGQYTYGAIPDERIQLAFTRFAGLGDYPGNIKALMSTRYKAAYDEHAAFLKFLDTDEGEHNKQLWLTESNLSDKDDSPDILEYGADQRLGVYSNSLLHAIYTQETFLKNLKMNYDQDYINNFFTISTVQSFLGGNTIDLVTPADRQDQIELGMNTCSDAEVQQYYIKRTIYHEFMLLSNIYSNNMEYIKTETSMYSGNINVQPTLFYDEGHQTVVGYYTNSKDVIQKLAIDLGDLSVITGYPTDFDESDGITITHIDPQNLYSNSGQNSLWLLNSAYDAGCTPIGTFVNRFEIRQITTSLDPIGGCPPIFAGGICIDVPASSVGYFTIPLIELRQGTTKGELNIYPNPTSDSFYFILKNFGSEYGRTYAVSMFDLNGNLVLKTNAAEGDKLSTINLPVGLYKVVIADENKIIATNSLVKM